MSDRARAKRQIDTRASSEREKMSWSLFLDGVDTGTDRDGQMSDGADEGTWRGNGRVTLEQTIAGDVSESLVRPSQLSSLQRSVSRTNDAKKRQALDGITERRRRGTGRGVCGCAAAEGRGTGCSEKPGRTRGLKLDMSRGGQARVWVGAAAEGHPPSWLYSPDPSTERGRTRRDEGFARWTRG